MFEIGVARNTLRTGQSSFVPTKIAVFLRERERERERERAYFPNPLVLN